MKRKMLTFFEIFLASFIYDTIEIFAFPKDYTRDIYLQNKIKKYLPYLRLPDTDSASFLFLSAIWTPQ